MKKQKTSKKHSAISNKAYTITGIILLIYIAGLLTVRVYEQGQESLLWITHMSLFLAVPGFLFRNNFLLSSSLVSTAFFHLLWAADFVVSYLFGLPFLQMTEYLHSVSWWFFAFTFHHVWLDVMVFVFLWKEKTLHRHAWIGASSLFAVSVLLSLVLTNENVNCARTVCQPLWFIPQPPFWVYLPLMLLLVTLALYLPLSILLRKIIER